MRSSVVTLVLAVITVCVQIFIIIQSPSVEVVSDHANKRALGYSDRSPIVIKARRPHASNNDMTSIVTGNDDSCHCELVSIDCLDSIRCVPRGRQAQEQIAIGVTTRSLIRETARWTRFEIEIDGPLGKALQYSAIEVWDRWMHTKELPPHFPNMGSLFVDPGRYPQCQKRNIIGWKCIFAGYKANEDVGALEATAQAVAPVSMDAVIAARIELLAFLSNSQTNEHAKSIPALRYLLSFAHILRLGFNRRPFIRDLYEKNVKVISHSNGNNDDRLRVSLYMRRADSCDHHMGGYETQVSDLSSPPQVGVRMCYETSVYMDGLRRVQRLAGRPLDVYLSTDHAGSLMAEIRRDFEKEYKEMNWHFLDFPREIFNYKGVVEGDEHNNHGVLGETAISDLWHLSHGQVFVGNLGSRFGKVGWLLATSRHNTFIPFWTVDGHSFCCEIDENCGEMKPYIDSMENCMTFAHELLNREHEDYWRVGSRMRQIDFELRANRT